MDTLESKLGLTPQERRIVEFHNETLKSGKKYPHPEGRGNMTVYSTGIKIPDGPFAGSFVSVPGLNRETGKPMSEKEALRYWRKEIDAGQWPLYGSGPELNARSSAIHAIMDRDAKKMK
jgi:hypothetical protein